LEVVDVDLRHRSVEGSAEFRVIQGVLRRVDPSGQSPDQCLLHVNLLGTGTRASSCKVLLRHVQGLPFDVVHGLHPVELRLADASGRQQRLVALEGHPCLVVSGAGSVHLRR